jgi:hypothetical protein
MTDPAALIEELDSWIKAEDQMYELRDGPRSWYMATLRAARDDLEAVLRERNLAVDALRALATGEMAKIHDAVARDVLEEIDRG